MQQRSFQVIFFLWIFFPLRGDASLTFNLSPNPKDKRPPVAVEKNLTTQVPKAALPNISSEKTTEALDEESLNSSLQRYELILSQEKKIENIIVLKFNQIVCYMQLARISRIRTGGKSLVNDEEQHLKKALKIIDDILGQKKIPNELISQMYYFQGLSYLDLGLKEKSRQLFEKAIVTYPNSKFVTSLSLYLADLYYDERDLPKALEGYKRFYSKMGPQEKDLADYKMAWIYMNQSQIDQAVNLFIDLVKRSTSTSMVQDAILSLSVALSEKFDQESILARLDKDQIPEHHKLDILSSVYENFLKQPQKERSKIWEKILHSKAGGEGIVKLISNELQMMELGDKIEKEVYSLQNIQKYLLIHQKKIKGFSAPLLTSLGFDLERLISKSLTLYQKEKTDNRYKMLRLTIDSYLKLNVFKRQVEVASLLMDLLTETNEDEQLMSLCQEILANPQYQVLREKAKLLVLLNFEKKYLNDPKNNQSKFFSLVKIYLKNLKAEQWENVAQKFCDYLVKANLYNDAQEVAVNLNQYYPKEDHFLRLITIKFELKKCPDIISLLSNKKELDKKLIDYKRECHLIMAQDSKTTAKSFSGYQQNIQDFIGLSQGAKKNAAIADYLNTMEEIRDKVGKESNNQKFLMDYQNLLEHQFFAYRFEKEIFPVYQREILRLVENGDFKKALFYLNNCDKNSSCSSLFLLASSLQKISSFDGSKDPSILLNQKLEGDMSKYLSLVYPETILKLYWQDLDRKNPDPRILLVASRLSNIDWADSKFKNIYDRVSGLLTKDEKPFIYASSWIGLDKIHFPMGTTRHRLKDQDILMLMKKVQQTRQLILSELSIYSLASQKMILTKAMNTELRMGEVIKLSAIPKNLDPVKVGEYEEGLKKLAEEFIAQSESYRKSLSNLDQQQKNNGANIYEQLIPPQEIVLWPWGTPDAKALRIKQFVHDENYVQALFYLDYLLSLSKITTEDYYLRRSGILLISASKRKKVLPMVKYVWEECESGKQTQMLSAWQLRSKK